MIFLDILDTTWNIKEERRKIEGEKKGTNCRRIIINKDRFVQILERDMSEDSYCFCFEKIHFL